MMPALAALLEDAPRPAGGRAGQRRPDVLRASAPRWCGCSAPAGRGAAAPVVGVAGLRPAGLGGRGGRRWSAWSGARSSCCTPHVHAGAPAAGAGLRRGHPRRGGGAADRGAATARSRSPCWSSSAVRAERPFSGTAGDLAARRHDRSAWYRGRVPSPTPGTRAAAHARAAGRRLRARRPADQARGPRGDPGARWPRCPGSCSGTSAAGAGSIGIEWMRHAPDLPRRRDRGARRPRRSGSRATPPRSACPGLRRGRRRGARGAGRPAGAGRGVRRRRRRRRPACSTRCWEALRPGGRLVVNAVTLESEAVLAAWYARLGGDAGADGVSSAPSRSAASPAGGPRCRYVQWAVPKPMTVHFIGAGPGAADLITAAGGAAARRRARSACTPARWCRASCSTHCPPGARLVDTAGPRPRRDHRRAGRRAPRPGQDVARLHSGDLSIYSAMAEQMRRLDAAGVPWEVIPGVPAFAAAAAALRPRADRARGRRRPSILTRDAGRATPMPAGRGRSARWPRTGATLVLHLGRAAARRGGRRSWCRTTAPTARRRSWPGPAGDDEVVLRGTLADIADQAADGGVRRTAIVFVGPGARRRAVPRQPPVLDVRDRRCLGPADDRAGAVDHEDVDGDRRPAQHAERRRGRPPRPGRPAAGRPRGKLKRVERRVGGADALDQLRRAPRLRRRAGERVVDLRAPECRSRWPAASLESLPKPPAIVSRGTGWRRGT